MFCESLQTQGSPAQGPATVTTLTWGPAQFVMVGRVLECIKERAEVQPLVPDGLQVLARVGRRLAGAALLGVFAAWLRWWPWLLVPVVLLVPPFLAKDDLDSRLAGLLGVDVTRSSRVPSKWRNPSPIKRRNPPGCSPCSS